MKKLSIVAVPLLLGLWAGYALGYNQGTRNEKQAWISTASPGTASTNPRLFCYRNPHTGRSYGTLKQRAVNVPDPRVYEKYSRSPN